MDLPITDEERRILVDVLETAFSRLRDEVPNTERLEVREALKRREEVIRRVVELLKAPV